ncbi:MAG: glutamate synthase subunit beta [Deltaproteobacteria bacterium]|jgi:glutamate synthase (NADPH/NADH) small chain|nr:glutamate synthase subunit beta [Deltaproteobacteria bacterium]
MSEYRPVRERLSDFLPVELRPRPQWLAEELKRCQDCGIPFCHAAGCDLRNVIPEINLEALGGRYESALWKLLETNPFPEFTARVCPALCEGSCVRGLHEEPVPARLVEYEVSERAFEAGLMKPVPPAADLGLSVGVAGSGPAGLAAAFYLARAGAKVAVYEKDARPGGFLRYGIPDFKLDKAVIERRIALMEEEGVVFETGVDAGTDVSRKYLLDRHDALILATGCREKRDLRVPGRELSGILFATDYLTAQNKVVGGELASLPRGFDAKGKKVLVIGGGDTGSDCVGTALRQGATSVSQFEIMPEPPKTRAPDNPWPQWPRVLRTSSSHEEGCLRRWSVDTVEFLPRPDDDKALGGAGMRLVDFARGEDGRLRPVPVPGSGFREEADLVLLAMGFTGPEKNALRDGSTKPGPGGRLEPGIYVAGDAASGPGLVVRAIASGLGVAKTLLSDFKTLPLAL